MEAGRLVHLGATAARVGSSDFSRWLRAERLKSLLPTVGDISAYLYEEHWQIWVVWRKRDDRKHEAPDRACRGGRSMDSKLESATVRSALRELEAVLPHDACHTCECMQGFLAQLRMDADDEAGALILPWLAPRGQVHSCLGCAPCPPGDQFAASLRNPSNSRQQPIVLI